MMKFIATFLVVLLAYLPQTSAHCEIPCGIFDDGARFEIMLEHATTIEKSMKKIQELESADKPSIHDISRWTVNKEKHAQLIQNDVAQYFLAQRVKTPKAGASEEDNRRYQESLTLLHKIIVAAMKTKQSTDTLKVNDLVTLIEKFEKLYFSPHEH